MARSVKGHNYARYLALMSRMGGDIERMSPRTRKAYLRRRLRLVEAQIRSLSNRLGVDLDDSVHSWAWVQEPFGDDSWEVLVSLDYLIAAREALVTTIERL